MIKPGRFLILFMLVLGFFSFSMSATAVENCKRGTKDEAVALVKQAIEHYKTHGRAKAFATITNFNGPFRVCDLFIIVFDARPGQTGMILAHAGHPKMVAINIIGVTDKNGVRMVPSFYTATEKPPHKGWGIEYVFPNPITDVVERKNTYVEKFFDAKNGDLLFACGYHIPN